jgi:hypothetical protein
VIATFPGDPALHPGGVTQLEPYVFSCDYNGWADVPEEEREGIDAFEASGPPPIAAPAIQKFLPVRWVAREILPQRKAA